MLTGGEFGYLGDYVLWWLLYLSLLVHTWCFFRLYSARTQTHRKNSGRPSVSASLKRWSLLLFGNCLVFVCFTGFLALAAESYLRFVSVETDAFGLSLPARRWFALHTRLNSLGFRDKEWTVEKPPGVRRIAFVGDSYTYGWGVERVEDRFPDRIQAMFDDVGPTVQSVVPAPDPPGSGARSPAVEVMNVAKPGDDSGAQLANIRKVIAVYAVDEVVLCYLLNDIEQLLPRTNDFDPISPPKPVLVNPHSSCLVDYLYARIWLPRAPTVRGYHDWLADGFAEPSIWQRHQAQLLDIITHCRDHGVTLRVVLLPYTRVSGAKFDVKTIHEAVRRFFERNDAQVLDLSHALDGIDPADLTVNSHDAHPNERANALFADAIWRAFYAHSPR